MSKAFKKWQNNCYLGKTLNPYHDRIVLLMRDAYEAGERNGFELSADKVALHGHATASRIIRKTLIGDKP